MSPSPFRCLLQLYAKEMKKKGENNEKMMRVHKEDEGSDSVLTPTEPYSHLFRNLAALITRL